MTTPFPFATKTNKASNLRKYSKINGKIKREILPMSHNRMDKTIKTENDEKADNEKKNYGQKRYKSLWGEVPCFTDQNQNTP